jgi:hypothetical protein
MYLLPEGNKIMNARAVKTPSLDAELQDEETEDVRETEVPVVTPPRPQRESPLQRPALKGYDATMRRHAAACEAGR